jgi:hypothetical protein
MVGKDDAIGDVEGVMVGEADNAGPQPYSFRTLAGRGDQHLRAGDDFPTAGVVLAEPHLVEAEFVEMADEVEIAAQCERRVFASGLEWR